VAPNGIAVPLRLNCELPGKDQVQGQGPLVARILLISVSFVQTNGAGLGCAQSIMISRTATRICHRCAFGRLLRSAFQPRFQSTGNCSIEHELPTVGMLTGRAVLEVGPKFLADGLLRRAQQLSNEHSELEKQLANSYDKKLATRAGRLASVSQSLKEYQDAIAACSQSSLTRS